MTQTYQGSCHCGRVRFELRANIDHARVCDCSLCRRRGALNFRVEPEQVRFLTPLEDMTLYQWNTMTAKDYFCPTCGMLPFRQPRTAPHLWTVNLRCLEDFDLDSVEWRRLDGQRLSTAE
jgi:hypothetical protein